MIASRYFCLFLVGLTAVPYEQGDEKTDGDLVKALQETVWQVVTDQQE